MADVAPPRRPFRSIWVAIPAAVLAGFAGLFALGAIISVKPVWLGFALHSSSIAMIWMLAGGYFAPRTHLALGAVFVPGALLCAWLGVGFVSGVSAYYGIATIAISCFAGSAVWYWYVRTMQPVASRTLAFVVPAATAVVLTAAALLRPSVGMRRNMWDLDRTRIPAHVANRTPHESEHPFVWTPSRIDRDSVSVSLELDSDDSRYTLYRLRTDSERLAACTAFRERSRALDSGNVAEGAIPRIVTVLPRRQIGCSAGSYWVAERPHADQAALPAHVGSMKEPASR
jgi:hypothetical protein